MLKTLLGEVKEYKKDTLLTPVFMIFEVIFETVIPLIMGMIITELESGDTSLKKVYIYGGVMVLLALGALLTGILGGIYGARASVGFGKNLRKAMYRNIQTFSFSNIDKFSTSSLVTRMTTDVTNLQNSFQMLLRMCMRAPANLIIALIFSISLSPKLSSVYLIAVVFLGIALIFIGKKATALFVAAFPKYDKLNESIQENVTAIRVVKGFSRENHENKKLKTAAGDIYKTFVKAEGYVISLMPIMMSVVYTCILLISWFGAKLIVAEAGLPDGFTVGSLSSLLAYCMQILISLMLLGAISVMITMSAASAERVAEVLNEKTDISSPENAKRSVKDGSIEFKNVVFRYNKNSETPVLDNINISIRSGETIGIMGPTGSSKTSLVNLISRLYDVSSGEVLVGGVNVKEYDLEVLRDNVSVVLQKNVLFSGTILDNLRWGKKDATKEECIEVCRIACADDFVGSFPDGYETVIEQGGTNVSGGQKQRLCIARALLKNPAILILDDSTSAVDTATDKRIRSSLAEYMPDMTKIIIAQRISSIQNADRIIVMDEGRVSAIGTHEELLEKCEIYRDVYEAQTVGNGDFDEVGGEG